MKPNLSTIPRLFGNPSCRRGCRRVQIVSVGTVLVTLLIGFDRYTRAQLGGKPPASADPGLWQTQTFDDSQAAQDLARLALEEPEAFNAEIEKVKSAAEKAADLFERWTIQNMAAYRREFLEKDPAFLELEAKAAFAITRPVEATAQFRKVQTPDQQEAERIAAEAILHPQF